jgi:hypothetical protein
MTVQSLLALLELQFPNFATNNLWLGNVFHGEYQLYGYARKGFNVQAADASTRLLQLWKLGVIEPVEFQPSHSAAATLGLTPAYHDKHRNSEPCPGTAFCWTWRVVSEDVGKAVYEFMKGENDG